jgi:hypothetical protein
VQQKLARRNRGLSPIVTIVTANAPAENRQSGDEFWKPNVRFVLSSAPHGYPQNTKTRRKAAPNLSPQSSSLSPVVFGMAIAL